jgi:MFS family permease
MGLGQVFRKRWTSAHFRQSFWIAVVAIVSGAILASIIQKRFGLYSSAMTMTLVGMATAAVGMLIIWLLDRRRYGWAWAVTLIVPSAVFLAFLSVLDGNPPKPPLG